MRGCLFVFDILNKWLSRFKLHAIFHCQIILLKYSLRWLLLLSLFAYYLFMWLYVLEDQTTALCFDGFPSAFAFLFPFDINYKLWEFCWLSLYSKLNRLLYIIMAGVNNSAGIALLKAFFGDNMGNDYHSYMLNGFFTCYVSLSWRIELKGEPRHTKTIARFPL